ncbi:LutB/LldF family L-lactate oxidation iron-sulfur protein [Alicyclobacillus ferrooxydans]|uniref:Amino acid dehydrogenase n=1 Tax=Alicyclobacillus ferrooxydans TaxID=471514 RepID=A0A0P9CG52_9BACL|nr:LutB/LldF family L-lactate oxidation iron-sulfur protein [Alicyclobacillus ferrooxydans]KPV44542.1 amino acid dehydrogenase [Alicyclobacillus ferrooxydans]
MTTEIDGKQTGVLDRSRLALQDDFLRAAVRFTADRLRGKKRIATESLGNWETWRERGMQIRSHTVANLDYYLAQFTENVEAAGGHVHFADDAAEAAQTVMNILMEKQARSVVKSKSMVSEEIGINHLLEEHGIEVVETDLGEYIVQLARETPSHIIIPAIHKNRRQIKDLFTEAGGENLTTDTKTLTAFARNTMRNKFLRADVGITGCNFGIAESGSVVLFTNEGNADMVTNLPKTHIVLMGMERLLPAFADLEVMANLLPRAATGQSITTYMSVITGNRRRGDIDGAQEMHLIVLDNGRSRQIGDAKMQSVLNCIRCGACLNVCPVYRQIGGHAYGSVYPGPIGAVLSPVLNEGEKYADLPYASSLCGACSEACPVKIPLHDLLVHLRQRHVEHGHTKTMERLAFRGFKVAFSRPNRLNLAIKMARLGQKALVRNGHIESTLGPLKGWTAGRDAPTVAKQSFHDRWRTLQSELQTQHNHALEPKAERGGDVE